MYNNKTDYYKMWLDDRQAIFETMCQNMIADLKCGYKHYNNNIKEQTYNIQFYQLKTIKIREHLEKMNINTRNKTAYELLVNSGAIDV